MRTGSRIVISGCGTEPLLQFRILPEVPQQVSAREFRYPVLRLFRQTGNDAVERFLPLLFQKVSNNPISSHEVLSAVARFV